MRILFITNARIGDAVLSSGILRHVAETNPAARFTVVCGPLAQSLFAAVPRLDRVIPLRKRAFDLHWWDLWRMLKNDRWDIAIDLRGSLVCYALRAGRRYVARRARAGTHRVVHLTSVLGLAQPAAPHLYMHTRHEEAARHLVPDGPPVLAVAPIAAAVHKTWPAAHFSELLAMVTRPGGPCAGWRVAFFGGPGDEVKAAALLAAHPGALHVFGEPDLLTVHAALRRCRTFVGNDSGLAHLAAAAGVPTLALFGPSDPACYAPWGPHADFVAAPDRTIAHLAVANVAARLGCLVC